MAAPSSTHRLETVLGLSYTAGFSPKHVSMSLATCFHIFLTCFFAFDMLSTCFVMKKICHSVGAPYLGLFSSVTCSKIMQA